MIYFVQSGDSNYVKIGYAGNVEKRLYDLQAGNPFLLVTLGLMNGCRKVEKKLHRKFEKYNYRSEWFYLTEGIKEFIDNIESFDVVEFLEEDRRRQEEFFKDVWVEAHTTALFQTIKNTFEHNNRIDSDIKLNVLRYQMLGIGFSDGEVEKYINKLKCQYQYVG